MTGTAVSFTAERTSKKVDFKKNALVYTAQPDANDDPIGDAVFDDNWSRESVSDGKNRKVDAIKL